MKKLTKPFSILLIGFVIGGVVGGFISTHEFIWRSPLVIKAKTYKQPKKKVVKHTPTPTPTPTPKVKSKATNTSILPFKKFLTERNSQVREKVLKLLKEKYNYTGDELIAMDNIFKKEAGYNPTAVNSQGCKGLGQDCLNRMKCELSYSDEAIECQVDWTIGYVKGRYGSPIVAWKFHRVRNFY